MLFAGPPGLGKTTLAQIVARELGVEFPRDLGPGDRQGGRSRGAAHQSRRPRRAVHRRDPPAQSGGRGNPLSGDGGLPARPDHRRGARGALGAHRSRPLHADRRDHPHRPADHAAAGSLRHSHPARVLRASTSSRRSCGAARGCSGSRSRATARTRSPGARAARRASPGRLLRRVRDFAAVEGAAPIDARSPTRRCRSSRSTRAGSMRSTTAICALIAVNYGGGPVGIETIAAGAVGAARRHRGDHRALSVAAGLHRAHPARPGADGAGLRPSRPAAPAQSRPNFRCSTVRRIKGTRVPAVDASISLARWLGACPPFSP